MNLVGEGYNVIDVKPIGKQDALTLLKLKTQVNKSSKGDAQELVKMLEGILLTVTQAGAYIIVNKLIVDIAAYLNLFRKSKENQAHLLNNKEARDIRQDATISSAVITT